jgi:hypothetical protein
MKKNAALIALCCILLSACTATKPLISSVNPTEVTELKLLEPYSYISMVKKGNRGELDDSISAIVKNLITEIITTNNQSIPLSGNIFLSDSSINKKLEKEFESLILFADRNRTITNLNITQTLDEVLEANQTRFGLIVVCTGFTRAKGNYGKEIAKGAAIGILTLGMVVPTPVKAYSTIYTMIVDSDKNNVAFYRKSFLQDGEPLDKSILAKQYSKIFEGYFWNSK